MPGRAHEPWGHTSKGDFATTLETVDPDGFCKAVPAAVLRTLSNKEKRERKKQRKLLDAERSLRRPGWEKDPDTEPLEVPNAEHQRAGLEWIWEQLVARPKDDMARFPELWD